MARGTDQKEMHSIYGCTSDYSQKKQISVYLETQILKKLQKFSILVENHSFFFLNRISTLHSEINYVKEKLFWILFLRYN